jgi:xylulokinase
VSVVPEVLGPTERAGAWEGAVVAPGTGDNMAAALGLGLRPGDTVVSLGTSGTVFTVSDEPTADPSGAVAGFADAAGRFLPLVCTLNATKVTEAMAGWLGVSLDELGALAEAAGPGAGGVVLLPYLDGERTPNRPGATGVLTGLRPGTTREQLARAAYEGVVSGLLDGLDALSAHATTDGRLLLVGGGARSATYRRVLADLSGRVVTVPLEEELVAAGACVQAAATLTGADPVELVTAWGLDKGIEVEPGPGAARAGEVRAAYAAVRDAG